MKKLFMGLMLASLVTTANADTPNPMSTALMHGGVSTAIVGGVVITVGNVGSTVGVGIMIAGVAISVVAGADVISDSVRKVEDIKGYLEVKEATGHLPGPYESFLMQIQSAHEKLTGEELSLEELSASLEALILKSEAN